MELTFKKINFLGDSITEGHGSSGKGHIFCDLVGEAFGAEVRNYGIGGTRFALQLPPDDNPNDRHNRNFCDRVAEMDPDADTVVVFGGTNDFGHGNAPLGTPADRTYETFYGACHQLFSTLLAKYPTALIVVMTPLHRANEENPRGDGNKSRDYGTLADYVRIIREVAEEYALPVLDLFAFGGIQPKYEEQRVRLCPDGLHPNDEGHKIIARKLIAFLKNQ